MNQQPNKINHVMHRVIQVVLVLISYGLRFPRDRISIKFQPEPEKTDLIRKTCVWRLGSVNCGVPSITVYMMVPFLVFRCFKSWCKINFSFPFERWFKWNCLRFSQEKRIAFSKPKVSTLETLPRVFVRLNSYVPYCVLSNTINANFEYFFSTQFCSWDAEES